MCNLKLAGAAAPIIRGDVAVVAGLTRRLHPVAAGRVGANVWLGAGAGEAALDCA